MTNREIYAFALHALAQHQISEESADFEERAPYLLAACCTEAQALDTALRKLMGQETAPPVTGVCLSPDGAFPLSQPFAPLAGFYLAAMLVVDEDSELSDKLYEHYCDGMASLQARVTTLTQKESTDTPWTLESIGEVYFAK